MIYCVNEKYDFLVFLGGPIVSVHETVLHCHQKRSNSFHIIILSSTLTFWRKPLFLVLGLFMVTQTTMDL